MVSSAPSIACTPGSAILHVDHVAGASSITRAFASEPLKLLTPVSRGPSVRACLSNYGGGVVTGDRTRLDLHLAPNTCAVVGTQASTKIYRASGSLIAFHDTTAHVAQGALLVLAPDAVQPFAGSRYQQTQRFELAPDASLAALDWVSAGRVARGERWAFQAFRSRTEIRVAQRPVLLDQLELDPANGPVSGPFRTGSFDCLASLVLLGPRLAAAVARVKECVRAMPVRPGTQVVAGLSPLRDGLLVRLAGDDPARVQATLFPWLQDLDPDLDDHPWGRRW